MREKMDFHVGENGFSYGGNSSFVEGEGYPHMEIPKSPQGK